MSKIICDVCGTSYPEASAQCPICGCVRSADTKTAYDVSGGGSSNGEYVFVKGGRFSKSNVKKRNRGEQLPQSNKSATPKKGSNKGLVIAICLLLLAIIAVAAYIYFRFFAPANDSKQQEQTKPSASVSQQQTETQESTSIATEATELVIPCVELTLSPTSVEFDKVGVIRLLNVKVLPADTTDVLEFSSTDEAVVTVNGEGKLQAVGPGEADIIVVCGDISETCSVRCTFEVETTPEETEAETQPTVDPENFKLLSEDVTLSTKGEVWYCYNEDVVGIPAKDIEWSSDDEKVATVTDGKVVAVSTGVTTIRAKYDDMEATCVVRCSERVGAYVEPTEPADEDGSEPTVNKTCTVSASDVTIRIGEQFDLVLQDSEGYPLDAQWQVSNECCTVEGNIVTGVAAGTAEVFCVYNDVRYACIVRVY